MKLRSFYRPYKSLAALGYVRVINARSFPIFNAERTILVPKSPSNSTIKLSSDKGHGFSESKCWRCDNVGNESDQTLFCSKCKALQPPPENLNHFKLIGVDENYDVKNHEIQDKYRRLQNLLHPDRFSNSSEKEKELSDTMSSLVNKAYSTLSHPLNRGLYMLELNGVTIPEGTTSLDPEFLMEIMEKNEEIEEASKDSEKILRLMKENRETLEDCAREVSAAFRENDVRQARSVLVRMKYYASIEATLKNMKQSLGIVE